MDIIKNPVILGLTAGVLTYLYIQWNEKNNEKKNEKKRGKKGKKKSIGLIIPAVVTVIVWFIAYGYFKYSNQSQVVGAQQIALPHTTLPLAIPNYKLVHNNMSSDQVRSFSLIEKGVKVPSNLPDVFIETF